ncbi:CRISPR-associated protein, Csy2 family [Pollutimonas bauzanensis]|uniref:CRISPR-associated protein, Csy2 family n=1 Tax=Pollutimonas bauzanensis TaxID=658167 RepID=A0A1M5Y4Z9_9BURK|nr:CRISPR-associated protein, Csy2 family [Pollutimonas bauzanensis]
MSALPMSALPDSNGLLILPRIRVQNANAISSPITHGFPSITAFLGLQWALERKLLGKFPVVFDSIGVVCHDYEEQTAKGGYTKSFCLTRNPIEKDGSTAAIVEEGRIHLDITLLLGISGGCIPDFTEDERAAFAYEVAETVARMRIAGGSVVPGRHGARGKPQLVLVPLSTDAAEANNEFRLLRRRWLPGFALVSRDDLLARRWESLKKNNPRATKFDALLDLSRLNWRPGPAADANDPQKTVEWLPERKDGWIVPMPVGYGALAQFQAGAVEQARDLRAPFSFVESLYSAGQWISPHRLGSWRDLLWYGRADTETGLYRACNDYVQPTTVELPY